MTEKRALLAAIDTFDDVIETCLISYGWEENDPYILKIKEAQAKLKEMFERME